MQFLPLLLANLPQLLGAAMKNVQWAAAELAHEPGENRAKAATEALEADYDLLDHAAGLPDAVDTYVRETLIPSLVELAYRVNKEEKAKEAETL